VWIHKYIYIYILIFIILYIDRQTYVKFELFILASNCRYPKIQVSYYASQIPPRDCVNLHTLTRGPACSRAATCLRARGASARRLSCCHVALNPCWFPTNSTSLLRHALMLPCGFKIVVAPWLRLSAQAGCSCATTTTWFRAIGDSRTLHP
jgi:hypothetical protein